jgi:ketosteroid isomerase-like protein
MKKILFSIFICLLCNSGNAQKQFTKEQQEVQQAIVKMFEALSNRDSISLKTYCTSDATFYEYGEIWTIDTLVRKGIAMNKATDFKRTNTFDFISTSTDKAMAWATYRLNSVIVKDGKQVNVEWLETVTLINEKKQWKIKHLHSTLIKRS